MCSKPIANVTKTEDLLFSVMMWSVLVTMTKRFIKCGGAKRGKVRAVAKVVVTITTRKRFA